MITRYLHHVIVRTPYQYDNAPDRLTVYCDTLCLGRHGGSLITIPKLQTYRIYIIMIYICQLCILVIRRYILTMK
jgi:hypothetical protein